jgi:hypothetical protein
MFVSIIHALNFQFSSKKKEVYNCNVLKTVRNVHIEKRRECAGRNGPRAIGKEPLLPSIKTNNGDFEIRETSSGRFYSVISNLVSYHCIHLDQLWYDVRGPPWGGSVFPV